MSNEPRTFGVAETQYNEWRGTVALDEGFPSDDDLYDLFQLDREKWTILALNVFGSHDETVLASVCAVYTETIRQAREAAGDQWPEYIATQNKGRIPVTEFDLDEEPNSVMTVLSKHKQWDIHAMPSVLADTGLELAIVSSPEDLMFLDDYKSQEDDDAR